MTVATPIDRTRQRKPRPDHPYRKMSFSADGSPESSDCRYPTPAGSPHVNGYGLAGAVDAMQGGPKLPKELQPEHSLERLSVVLTARLPPELYQPPTLQEINSALGLPTFADMRRLALGDGTFAETRRMATDPHHLWRKLNDALGDHIFRQSLAGYLRKDPRELLR